MTTTLPGLNVPLKRTKLSQQNYGIAVGGGRFGGPTGIWLECQYCNRSDVIVGSRFGESISLEAPDSTVAKVFRYHGWKGRGNRMVRARCPDCCSKVGGC